MVDIQQVFKSMFKPLINEDDSVDAHIDRCQILGHALSKVDFWLGTGICTPPSNLNLNIGKMIDRLIDRQTDRQIDR